MTDDEEVLKKLLLDDDLTLRQSAAQALGESIQSHAFNSEKVKAVTDIIFLEELQRPGIATAFLSGISENGIDIPSSVGWAEWILRLLENRNGIECESSYGALDWRAAEWLRGDINTLRRLWKLSKDHLALRICAEHAGYYGAPTVLANKFESVSASYSSGDLVLFRRGCEELLELCQQMEKPS